MQKVIHVVGNRPQFIKLALLHGAIKSTGGLSQLIIHTGQHSSDAMSGIFFNQLHIPSPDVQLQVEPAPADAFTGNAATAIAGVLKQHQKDSLVLVYGDTNTTLAAALAATRSNLPLFHFEAGVRNPDTAMPEEINRVLTDRLAQVHYCCTQKNMDTLLAEGYGTAIASTPVLSGDLMLDAFLHIAPAADNVVTGNNYVACTIHRAANITNRESLLQVVNGLNEIHRQMEVIVPLHPHTAKRLAEYNISINFTVIEPLGYQQMKRFLMDAQYVITDSGGTSREAFFMGKRSLIIMEYPFWPEIAEAGAAIACKANSNEMIEKFNRLPLLTPVFDKHTFGDGNAAQVIAHHLSSYPDQSKLQA